MKLLLTWLIGVPVLVGAMVLARATSPQGFSAPRPAPQVVASGLRQDHLDDMRPVVAKQRHELPGDGSTIQ